MGHGLVDAIIRQYRPCAIFGTLIQPENGGMAYHKTELANRLPHLMDSFLQQFNPTIVRTMRARIATHPVHKKWWNMVGGYSLEFSPA